MLYTMERQHNEEQRNELAQRDKEQMRYNKETIEEQIRYNKAISEQQIRHDKERSEEQIRCNKVRSEEHIRQEKERSEQQTRYDKEMLEVQMHHTKKQAKKLKNAVTEQQRLRGQLALAEARAVRAEERIREIEADSADAALNDLHQMLDFEAGDKGAKKKGKKKAKPSKSKDKAAKGAAAGDEMEAHVPSLELKQIGEEILELRDRLRDLDATVMRERQESAEAAKKMLEMLAPTEIEHLRSRRLLEKELIAVRAMVVPAVEQIPEMGDAELSALAEAARAESSRRQRLVVEEEVRSEMRAEREQERHAAAPPYAP
jgi:hypothetical protein